MTSLVVLVADGLRPDTLTAAMSRGEVPALHALAGEGALVTATTVFPSVTGPAYVPFLCGRFPGPAGLPGLRWFDRSRRTSAVLGYSRSYVGFEAGAIDGDLGPGPTLFERFHGDSLGAMSVISRGLGRRSRLGRGAERSAAVALAHLRGDVPRALELDRALGRELVARIRRDRPRVAFAAFHGIDKASHRFGHDSALVVDALRVVDDIAGTILLNAERGGRRERTHVWIVSDHGHAPVQWHDEIADFVRSLGFVVRAHPWTRLPLGDVAVMVSGNAMAHLYLEPERRERPWWPALRERWTDLTRALLGRPSVDLLIVAHSGTLAEIGSRDRGRAMLSRTGSRIAYRPIDGDPLALGPLEDLSIGGALEATWESDYPDSLVQVLSLATSFRAGDVVLSAASGWDFRSRFEPFAHRSTHGSLRREQMTVPLLVSIAPDRGHVRTVDVMPSILELLGVGVPHDLDGRSFVPTPRAAGVGLRAPAGA